MNNQENFNLEQDIIKYVSNFSKLHKLDRNGRFLSYDHLREVFLKYRKDESKREYITLHLFSYLASWGMLRNSFLMEKDYLFNKPIVDILCNDKYDPLLSLNPYTKMTENEINLILDLVDSIESYYLSQSYFDTKTGKFTQIKRVSITLTTKIILGTFGCTIAYDSYARLALSNLKLVQSISSKSIKQLNDFIIENQSAISKLQKSIDPVLYTPMKIVDMYLFEKGIDIELKNKNNN